MNALANHYGLEDGRYPAAVLIDAVISFAIEELSDARGGVLTLFPINELEDITVVFRSQSGSVRVSQMSLHDHEAKTIDLTPDEVGAVAAAILGKEGA